MYNTGKQKNRFCKEQQAYCMFANRCVGCEYYVGDRLCGRAYFHGKNKDYTLCHGKNMSCFSCDAIKFESNRGMPDYCKEAIRCTKLLNEKCKGEKGC